MYVYRRLIMITIIATIQGNEWQSWFYVLSYYFNSIFCSNENLAKLFTMEEYVDKSISKVSICHFSSLSTAHKNAIRGIRKIKYFVARRKFQQVSSHDPIDCCVRYKVIVIWRRESPMTCGMSLNNTLRVIWIWWSESRYRLFFFQYQHWVELVIKRSYRGGWIRHLESPDPTTNVWLVKEDLSSHWL